MFPLTFITITAIQLAHPYLFSDKIFCTEPDREAEYLLHLKEAATLWNGKKMNFITGFSDRRTKFHDRLQMDHCWPDDINGIPIVQPNADRATQQRGQKQWYIDYNLRGLKPNFLPLKAREQLLECPNATRNDFSTHNFQEDIMIKVCSNFPHDVEQIKTELTTMRQEMRNLRTELQEHRVNCMEGNFRPWAPTQKGNQKTVRFCNYCHKNGHTPKWYRKKCETKKYEKYNMECPPLEITLLPGTIALNLSTAASNTIKTRTNLLIRMMATIQLMNINLPKKKPGKMNPTKSLHVNGDPFQGTVV